MILNTKTSNLQHYQINHSKISGKQTGFLIYKRMKHFLFQKKLIIMIFILENFILNVTFIPSLLLILKKKSFQ